ncbi:MAG: DegT/DnrJ/EryC1/StrS family aminotransferase [Oscillospiraceae bacterium]|nr:DegT/DnrJ/EryC1/StrS family aminotransferase [Oscillospiraceae bacterium]
MQFIDLKAQYKALEKEINAGIQNVLERGDFILGKEVAELESQLAEYVGRKFCITCANGTDALSMVLMAWDIKAGDAVFVPSFTFMATAEVVSLRGATPVFVDIDPDTFNICVNSLENAIKDVISKGELIPRAVIPVDLFGLPADYDKILPIAKKYNLLVLEDGAQGFGGTRSGKQACSFGEAATTSFFPAKPLGCYGDGGAIFTDDEELCKLLKSIRVHGKGANKYDNVRIGLNSRLDTIQAAILLPKLKAFREYEVSARQNHAAMYTDLLKDTVKTPLIPHGYTSSFAQYTILLESEKQRDSLQAYLKENGIPSMIYYIKPLHLQAAYSDAGYAESSLPQSEQVAKRVLSLPMHPYLTEEEILNIANKIKSYISGEQKC